MSSTVLLIITIIILFFLYFYKEISIKQILGLSISLSISLVFAYVVVYDDNVILTIDKLYAVTDLIAESIFNFDLINVLYVVKNHFQYLITLCISTYVTYFFFIRLIEQIEHKVIFIFKSIQCNKLSEENKPKVDFDELCKCVLINGEWGCGKTYYYRHEIKPYLSKKPIYLSCFSATKDELITRLIVTNLLYNFISLNGVLVKFMLNNWQGFMPVNKIIVFDDLERMHSLNSYGDIIAIINFLKDVCNCKLILIVNSRHPNISESKVFNAYLEKIVDKVVLSPKINFIDIVHSLKKVKIDDCYKELVINSISQVQENINLNNLRLFINSYYYISNALCSLNGLGRLSGLDRDIISTVVGLILDKIIKMHCLYFKDNELYNKTLNHDIKDEEISDQISKYKLTRKEIISYDIDISHELSIGKLKNWFISYVMILYLQNKYSIIDGVVKNNNTSNTFEHIINKLKGAPILPARNWGLELNKDRKLLADSIFLNYLDDSILQFSGSDYSDVELYVWGCVLFNHNIPVSCKIAKILSSRLFSTGFNEYDEIVKCYRLWLHDLSISVYNKMFEGFAKLFVDQKFRYIKSDGYVSDQISVEKSFHLYDLFKMSENIDIAKCISKTDLYQLLFSLVSEEITSFNKFNNPVSDDKVISISSSISICLFYLYNLKQFNIVEVNSYRSELIHQLLKIDRFNIEQCISYITVELKKYSYNSDKLLEFSQDVYTEVITAMV